MTGMRMLEAPPMWALILDSLPWSSMASCPQLERQPRLSLNVFITSLSPLAPSFSSLSSLSERCASKGEER